MGTNYYLFENVCSHCGRGEESKHIGKSSGGWCFGLHVSEDEENGPHNLEQWKLEWTKPGVEIRNEYGEKIDPKEMLEIITQREGQPYDGRIPLGYSSLAEALEKNHAIIGPNNLWRHRISRGHCIGHGDGTWDLLVGEFS